MRALLALGLLAALVACGGGGSSGSTAPPVTLPVVVASNVLPVVVGPGPGNNVNIPYVSVRVCTPGNTSATQCRTIDRVLVDTASTGLRILNSSLFSLGLPAQTTPGSAVTLECAQFLSFVTWGPVKLADVYLGDKLAPALPIQIVADPAYPVVPSNCSSGGAVARSAEDMHANGILGLAGFVNDGQRYYNCVPADPSARCMVSLSAAQQVQNPVAAFDSDNNGQVLQLPAIGPGGASQAEGALIFGVGTRSNNQLGDAQVIQTDSRGLFVTTYKGVNLGNSFLDSGSNGLYFLDASLPLCGGALQNFFCPPATQNLNASLRLRSGGTDTVAFSIGNAASLLASSNFVYNNLGGNLNTSGFDWGLPFFFGRQVFTVIEGRTSPAGVGPQVAYTRL
jgi:hypothetical protein